MFLGFNSSVRVFTPLRFSETVLKVSFICRRTAELAEIRLINLFCRKLNLCMCSSSALESHSFSEEAKRSWGGGEKQNAKNAKSCCTCLTLQEICPTVRFIYWRAATDFYTWNGRLVMCLHDMWTDLLFFFCPLLFACGSGFIEAL